MKQIRIFPKILKLKPKIKIMIKAEVMNVSDLRYWERRNVPFWRKAEDFSLRSKKGGGKWRGGGGVLTTDLAGGGRKKDFTFLGPKWMMGMNIG